MNSEVLDLDDNDMKLYLALFGLSQNIHVHEFTHTSLTIIPKEPLLTTTSKSL